MSEHEAATNWQPVVYVGWKAAAKRTYRCLETIAGRPLIRHVVERLQRGLGRTVTVVHHEDAASARLVAALAGGPGTLFTSNGRSITAALQDFACSAGVEHLAVFAENGPFVDCETAGRMIDAHLRHDADCTHAPAHATGLLPIVMRARALDLLVPCDTTRPDWSDPFIRASELLMAPSSLRPEASTRTLSAFIDPGLGSARLPYRVLVTDRRTRDAASAVIQRLGDERPDARAASLFKEHWAQAVRRTLELAPNRRPPAAGTRRVLLVAFRDAFGGAEVSMYELVRALRRTSYEPIVLVQFECLLAEKVRALGVTVEVADCSLAELGPQTIALARDLLEHYRSDLLHLDSHVPFALSPPLILAAVARGIPIVAHARLHVPSFIPLSEIACHYDRVIAPSKYIAASLSRTFLTDDRIAQIYDGVDLDVFDPTRYDRASVRRTLGIPADAQVLTMVAAVSEQKRQDLLIEAMGHLRSSHPRALAFLVGETDSVERAILPKLRQQVTQRGLEDRVVFWGHEPEVARLLAASDAVVMCMREEGWGRSTVEAMAMGIPVVVPRAGGAVELVTGEGDGLTFEPDNVEDLILKLRTLLDDEPLRRRLSSAGRAIASQYSLEAHGRAVEAVYDELLSAGDHARTLRSEVPPTAIGLQ